MVARQRREQTIAMNKKDKAGRESVFDKKKKATRRARLLRLGCYVAMRPTPAATGSTPLPAPHHNLTGANLVEQRIAAYEKGFSTSHWSTIPPVDERRDRYHQKELDKHRTPKWCLKKRSAWSAMTEALVTGSTLPSSTQDRVIHDYSKTD